MKAGVVARVGAAVFVAGVSLGGAVPIAAADDDSGSGGRATEIGSEVRSGPGGQAGSVGPSRRSDRTLERGAAAVPVAEDRSRAIAGREPAAGVARQAPARLRSADRNLPPAVRAMVAPGSRASGGETPVAVTAEDSVDVSAGVGVVSARPGAAVADLRPVSAPVLSQSRVAAGATVARVLDTVGQWLSGLPAAPVTDFLSGALWLVRRTVLPVGSGVGLWGSAACVATKDCSGQDLTGADFTLQDLTKVNFTNAVLTSAILRDADLTEADLTGAGLQGANFIRAILVDANLSGVVASAPPRQVGTVFAEADLTGADLIGAELARSVLFRANLTDADLTGADLAGALLAGATWKNTTCPDGSNSGTGRPCSGSAPAAEAVFGPLVAGVGRVLGGVAVGVDRLLWAASQWVSGFPGPVASFMVGALGRVRQSLKENVVGLPGWSVSGTSVEVKNRTDQILVLRQDPDGIRGGSQSGPQWVFLGPGQNATFSGYHSDDKAVDVLLSVNLTKKIGDDTIATDETRMVLVANNSWISTPVLRVEAVDPPSLEAGNNLNRGYVASRPSTFFWTPSWDLLSEGEDCFCDAVNSGGPADGPQVYVARRDDSDDYKNFYVEIFSVGATPTGGGKDMYPVNKDALYYCNGKGAKTGEGWKGNEF